MWNRISWNTNKIYATIQRRLYRTIGYYSFAFINVLISIENYCCIVVSSFIFFSSKVTLVETMMEKSWNDLVSIINK